MTPLRTVGQKRRVNVDDARDAQTRDEHEHDHETTLTGQDPEDRVLKHLIDVQALMILGATAHKEKTVRDLSVELELPIATLYRKVRALEEAGALGSRKAQDVASHKETTLYKSHLQSLDIQLKRGSPVVTLFYADEGEDTELTRP